MTSWSTMVESAGTASRNASVMSQLEDTSRELKECYERLDFIETKLRRRYYPNDEKKRLEQEVKDIKTHLSRHEKDLRCLRGENRVAMILSVLILALGVMIYMVYTMLFTSWKLLIGFKNLMGLRVFLFFLHYRYFVAWCLSYMWVWFCLLGSPSSVPRRNGTIITFNFYSISLFFSLFFFLRFIN